MKMLHRAAAALLAAILCAPAPTSAGTPVPQMTNAGGASVPGVGAMPVDPKGTALLTSDNPGMFKQLSGTGAPSWSSSYVATGNGYAAYATPTDLFCLSASSAIKTVVVSRAEISAHTMATTNITYYLVRRSTANTGGSFAAQAVTPLDSGEPAATAVATLYSAAPTALGTTAGTLRIIEANGTVATAAAGVGAEALTNTVTEARRPVTLHAGEQLCLNMAGAALPLGFSAQWYLEWSEY